MSNETRATRIPVGEFVLRSEPSLEGGGDQRQRGRGQQRRAEAWIARAAISHAWFC